MTSPDEHKNRNNFKGMKGDENCSETRREIPKSHVLFTYFSTGQWRGRPNHHHSAPTQPYPPSSYMKKKPCFPFGTPTTKQQKDCRVKMCSIKSPTANHGRPMQQTVTATETATSHQIPPSTYCLLPTCHHPSAHNLSAPSFYLAKP